MTLFLISMLIVVVLILIEIPVAFAFGIGAVLFALYATSIVDALLISYAFWAPTILIPFVLGVLFRIHCTRAALWAMLVGALVTGFWNWGPLSLQQQTGITGLIAGVISNLLVFLLVYRTWGKRGTAD